MDENHEDPMDEYRKRYKDKSYARAFEEEFNTNKPHDLVRKKLLAQEEQLVENLISLALHGSKESVRLNATTYALNRLHGRISERGIAAETSFDELYDAMSSETGE